MKDIEPNFQNEKDQGFINGNLSKKRYNFLLTFNAFYGKFQITLGGRFVAQQFEQAVTVHLLTNITQDDDTEQFDFDLPGRLVIVNDNIYLRYVEDDNGQSTPVTFKLNGEDDVVLTRSGENGLKFHFLTGKAVTTQYRTPYGIMAVEVATTDLSVRLSDDLSAGRIAIDYQLLAGEQLIGDYQIRLHFTA
ncbi:hypothetical protein FD35_GL002448 [Furfurilactobacillus rossiae DSM 15814]|uniref:DUF1934 domain-containing protein n=1 Tax=Furfurilactobacillus rossiae DSM 15814 TaxID=1114972 RepID=A0A0R1RIC2_9LACO|nr:hypothetical protein FD35_GL002448 [Furfurilactobacillus rossiae DSM 15814]